MKKKQVILILGIICLVVSFLWMLLSQASVGPFLIPAGAGGALIADGVNKRNK